jgi:hypothetical protein
VSNGRGLCIPLIDPTATHAGHRPATQSGLSNLAKHAFKLPPTRRACQGGGLRLPGADEQAGMLDIC